MPKKIKQIATTSRSRKSIIRRKNKKEQGRKGDSRTTPQAPRIIANSIFALTLKDKPGIEILDKTLYSKRYNYDHEDNYEQMYHDLLACLKHATKIVKKDTTTFDPLESGLAIGTAMYYVVNRFKNEICPEGYYTNIDYEEGIGYYFSIFKECEFDGYWHAFEVKPLVDKLKNNPSLHKIFIEVLHCMMMQADISAWWNGGMGYAEYMLEEDISDWDNRYEWDSEAESMREYNKAVADWENYRSGPASEYENLITSAKLRSPKSLLQSLNKYRSDNRIANWLKEACEFLLFPGCVNDFIYPEHEDLEGLKFDQQVNIIWDFNDRYSKIQAECLDSEASSIGINWPIMAFPFTCNLKDFDYKDLKEREQWPKRLNKMYESHNKLIQSFYPKRYDK